MLQNSILLASVIDSICSVYQLQYNKQKKTIYGISFDYTLFQFLASSYLYYRPFYIYTQMSTQYDIPFIPTYQFLCRWLSFKFYNAFSNFGVVAIENIRQHTKYKSGNQSYSLIFWDH